MDHRASKHWRVDVSNIGCSISARYVWDCNSNVPALIISVAGRTLSVGTFCTFMIERISIFIRPCLSDEVFNLIDDSSTLNIGRLIATHHRQIYLCNWEMKIRKWITWIELAHNILEGCFRTTQLPWGCLRYHLQQPQRQMFLRVSKLQKHRQETLFHRREDNTRIKERSGVNSPLDELVMATLCSWTVLGFEGNLTKAGKAIRKPAESR